MNNPFVGFDTLRKQYDEDPDNPTGENLGLTGTTSPNASPFVEDSGVSGERVYEEDPTDDVYELPVRAERVGATVQPESVLATPDDPDEQVSFEELAENLPFLDTKKVHDLVRFNGLNSEQVKYLYRLSAHSGDRGERFATAWLSRFEAANPPVQNWEREAHRDEIASTEEWNRLRKERGLKEQRERNPFVGFETFAKQRTDDEHPYGEDSHLDDDSILERHGDVETGDDYIEPNDYDEDDDVDLQWGKVSDAAKGAVGAAKTAGQVAGATVGQAAQTAGGFAQDAASTGIAAGQQAARAGMDTAQTAGTAAGGIGMDVAQTGKKVVQAGAAKAAKTAQSAGQAAGAKVAGAFGKSHDDMMASLDQAIGFMEKQIDRDPEDEPTGNRTAVRSVERGDEDTLLDAPEGIEEFDYEDPTQLNIAQREAAQEIARNRQQGIAENEVPEPRSQRIYNPAAAALKDEEEERKFREKYGAVGPTPTSSEKKAQRDWEASPEYMGKREPRPSATRGFKVSTPENISTSDRINMVEAQDIQRRKDKRIARIAERNKIKTQRESRPLTPMERPYRPSKSEQVIEDDFSQSADSVIAKALGSVIDIMEKQDPKFRCQECGTKVPKGSRKCRKCGSEDIDLG